MPFNITGHPALTINCGFDSEGLPIGLQIVGHFRDETSVLRAAALAAEREKPGAAVRAGAIFLGGGTDVRWLGGAGPEGALAPEDHARFEDEAAGLARRLAEARFEMRILAE